MVTGKVPTAPPGPLTATADDFARHWDALWRIHPVMGRNPLSWNAFRTWGPVLTARFDPHPLPPGHHPGFGVSYTAAHPHTCAAEVFQAGRTIALSDERELTGWIPTRSLRLLDLTGGWALRNGAANALASAPRPVCRAWSSAILAAWPDLDGLYTRSTMDGRPVVVLYENAGDSFPAEPAFQRPLHHPVVHALMDRAAADCGYRLA